MKAGSYGRKGAQAHYKIGWPRQLEPAHLQAALGVLHGFCTPGIRQAVVLRSLGKDYQVYHYLSLPSGKAELICTQLKAAIPGVSFEELIKFNEPLPWLDLSPVKNLQVELRNTSKDIVRVQRVLLSSNLAPLQSKFSLQVSSAITAALAAAGSNEALLLQWNLTLGLSPQSVGSDQQSYPLDRGLVKGSLSAPFSSTHPMEAQARRNLQEKRAQAGWRGALYLVAWTRSSSAGSSPSARRANQLLGGLSAALRQANAPGVTIRIKPGSVAKVGKLLGETLPWRLPISIGIGELVSISGWPLGNLSEQPVVAGFSRHLPSPPSADRSATDRTAERRIVAVAGSPAQPKPLCLSAASSLTHLHVLGPTGVGKTTLLLNLILQDIAAGRGVVVIEPKGDLVEDILRRVPKERQKDVVVFDPSDANPVGLNPLASLHDLNLSSTGYGRSSLPAHQLETWQSLTVDGLIAIFKELFASSWGPRTQDILTAGLLTLMRSPEPIAKALTSLPRLFSDAAFRNLVLVGVNDPYGLNPFWQWFEALSPGERSNSLAPVMNKLRAFLLRPSLLRRAFTNQTKVRHLRSSNRQQNSTRTAFQRQPR